MNVSSTRDVLGTLLSFQTLLENYPVLLSDNYENGKDNTSLSISFLLDILKIVGIDNRKLFNWLGKLLCDLDDGVVVRGLLSSIEMVLKEILLTHITSLYTCPIDPVIPAGFMDKGYKIPLNQIDGFGFLKNCPTSKNGSIFYFDNKREGCNMNSEMWKSLDFNAFLWYVINNGNGLNEASMWDNRVNYRPLFYNLSNGPSLRDMFMRTQAYETPATLVPGVGVKKDIIQCVYREGDTVTDTSQGKITTDYLLVRAVKGRYDSSALSPRKTIRQFNTDYIYSLQLFDSKTLVTQIINGILGVSAQLTSSFELNLVLKKVEKIVEKVMDEEQQGVNDDDVDGYFVFSDEDYNEINEDATLKYNQQYSSGNENNEPIDTNINAITQFIEEIDYSGASKDQLIADALMKTMEMASSGLEIDLSDSFTFEKNLLFDFIKETATRVAMQMLTPKVMLLFAINARFLNDSEISTENISVQWEDFFKNFWNVMRSCVRRMAGLIINELYDLVISLLKPIISLVMKKLLLEGIIYYKELLLDLIEKCLLTWRSSGENLITGNVNYADIIPQQTTPTDGNS